MSEQLDQRRRTHLHGLVAGSLFVVSLFVAVAIPSALAMLLAGQGVGASLATILFFALLVAGAVREARAWQAGVHPQAF